MIKMKNGSATLAVQFLVMLIVIFANNGHTANPVLYTSPHFGAHPVVFYRGSNSIISINGVQNQPGQQKFQILTRYYTGIYKVGLCLSTTLFLYQRVTIDPIVAGTNTDRFNITYNAFTNKMYSVTFFLLVVTDTMFNGGFMSMVVRQNLLLGALSNVAGTRGPVYSQTGTQTTSMTNMGTNVKVIPFIHSIQLISNDPTAPLYHALIKITAIKTSSTNINLLFQATHDLIGMNQIGYTILIIDVDKLNNIGIFYSQTYSASKQTLTNDLNLYFGIPAIYGQPYYHTNCTIGFNQFTTYNQATNGEIDSGFFFNPLLNPPTSQSYIYPTTSYNQHFVMQIFCFLQYDCPYNQIYLNGTCGCSPTQILAGNYCTTIVGCINASLNQTGSVVCTQCGYGYKLNYSSTSNVPSPCICLDTILASGCTNMTGCLEISYTSPTSSICLTCATNLTLVNGQCLCTKSLRYNSSLGACVCIGTMVTGGCSQIPYCIQINFPTLMTSECFKCATGFSLSAGKCVNSTASLLGSSSSKEGGLDNVGLTVLVAVIGTVIMIIGFGLLYIIKFINQALQKASSKGNGSNNNHFNQQISIKSIQCPNQTQSSLQQITHEQINNGSNIKRNKRSKSKLAELDVYGMQL